MFEQSNWRVNVVALIAGVVFGLGLAISQMMNPEKVLSFLNVFGDWDPSLMFVMVGALAVFTPGYHFLVKGRSRPWFSDKFDLSTLTQIDKNLLIGASLFGLGWGIVGICPGPAIANLASFDTNLLFFVGAMMVGMKIAQRIKR